MKRIYSCYEEQIIDKLKLAAAERGFVSLSNFQKYCTLLYARLPSDIETENDKTNMDALLSLMKQRLINMDKSTTFIVSSLIPEKEWTSLNRGQKITLSIQLKKFIATHNNVFAFTGKVLPGRIKQYKKIGDFPQA